MGCGSVLGSIHQITETRPSHRGRLTWTLSRVHILHRSHRLITPLVQVACLRPRSGQLPERQINLPQLLLETSDLLSELVGAIYICATVVGARQAI